MQVRSRQIVRAALLSMLFVVVFAVVWKVGADAVSALRWRAQVRHALDQRPAPDLTADDVALCLLGAFSQVGTELEGEALDTIFAFLTEDRRRTIPDPASLKQELRQPALGALLDAERTVLLKAVWIEDTHAVVGVIANPGAGESRGYRILLARGRRDAGTGGAWRLAAILPEALPVADAEAPPPSGP
jgi:hypothetical protein